MSRYIGLASICVVAICMQTVAAQSLSNPKIRLNSEGQTNIAEDQDSTESTMLTGENTRLRDPSQIISEEIPAQNQFVAPKTGQQLPANPITTDREATPTKQTITPPMGARDVNAAGTTNSPATQNALPQRSLNGIQISPQLDNQSTKFINSSHRSPAAASSPAATGTGLTESVMAPAIQTQIIAPKFINVNQVAQLQINLQNVGQDGADQVRLIATLPQHARFVSSEPSAAAVNGQHYEFVISDVRPSNNRSIVLNLVPTAKIPLQIETSIQIESQSAVSVGVRQPMLQVDLQGPSTVQTGKWVDHKIIVKNIGDGIAEKIRLTAAIPRLLADSEKQTRVYVERLEPGQVAHLAYRTQAQFAGTADIQFAVSSEGTETKEMRTSLQVLQPELRVTANGPKANYVNRPGIYMIGIENTGQVAVTNVKIQVAVPSGIQVETISQQAKIDNDAGTLTWTFDKLEAGTREAIQMRAMGTQPGNQVCGINVSSTETEGKDFQVSTNVITRPDVSLRISDTGKPIQVGGNTEFVIEVENRGSSLATEVQISAELPEALAPVKHQSYTISESENRIVFDAISIPAGEKQQLKFSAIGVSAGEHIVRGALRFAGSAQQIVAEDIVYVFETENARVSEALTPGVKR